MQPEASQVSQVPLATVGSPEPPHTPHTSAAELPFGSPAQSVVKLPVTAAASAQSSEITTDQV